MSLDREGWRWSTNTLAAQLNRSCERNKETGSNLGCLRCDSKCLPCAARFALLDATNLIPLNAKGLAWLKQYAGLEKRV